MSVSRFAESDPSVIVTESARSLMSATLIPLIVLTAIAAGVIYALVSLAFEWLNNRQRENRHREYRMKTAATCQLVLGALAVAVLIVGVTLANHCLTTVEIASRLNATFAEVTLRGPLRLAFALKVFTFIMCAMCTWGMASYYKTVLKFKEEGIMAY